MAYWRFLHNASVTCDVMLGAAARHTAEAARGRHVLAIQDTTELNFSGHVGSKRGFGVVGNGRDIGLFLHPVIVVEAGDGDPRQVGHAGGIVGLADANIYSRKKAPPGFAQVAGEAAPGSPSDRGEGHWTPGAGSVRSRPPPERSGDGDGGFGLRERHLRDLRRAPFGACPPLGARRAQSRLKRRRQAVCYDGGAASRRRAGDRDLGQGRPPGAQGANAREPARDRGAAAARGLRGRTPPTVKANAVRVEEIDPPAGVKPIVWLLLTTHPVETLEDALRIVGRRRARWTIEQVFRVMKSQGFDLWDSQIETPEAMAKLALAVLIAALRTMQLVNARSGTTGQKLADAMDEAAEPLVEILTQKLEGKTLKLKNPHPTGTLARLAWVVGRLGGWDGYVGRGYKPPGPITMARGLIRFDAIREGWRLRQDV